MDFLANALFHVLATGAGVAFYSFLPGYDPRGKEAPNEFLLNVNLYGETHALKFRQARASKVGLGTA